MSDTRPSENADPLFAAAAEFGRTHLGWKDGDDEPALGWETADAQHIVSALDRLTEQQRVANLIAWEALTGEKNRAEIRSGLRS